MLNFFFRVLFEEPLEMQKNMDIILKRMPPIQLWSLNHDQVFFQVDDSLDKVQLYPQKIDFDYLF